MATLRAEDFETGYTDADIPDDVTVNAGAIGVYGSAAISGSYGLLSNSTSPNLHSYQGFTAVADIGVEYDFYYAGTGASGNGGFAGVHLRCTANQANAYVIHFITSGASGLLAICRYRVSNSETGIGSNVAVIASGLTGGDIIHVDASVVGNDISLYVWKNGDSKPGSPSATWTAASQVTAAGYVGFTLDQDGNGGTGIKRIDNIVIYDTNSATTIDAGVGNAVAAGAQASVTNASSSTVLAGVGNAAAAGATATVTNVAAGTITTDPLVNNTGTVLASETAITVAVLDALTGAHVVTKTNQTTNASGVMAINDPLIVAGTAYKVVYYLSGNRSNVPSSTAA